MKGTEDPSGLMARRSALIWSIAPVLHDFPDRNRAAINDKFLVLYHKKGGVWRIRFPLPLILPLDPFI